MLHQFGGVAEGIWYRRADGKMYAANPRDGAIYVAPLNSCTLEPAGEECSYEIEQFFFRFCRSEHLARAKEIM